MGSEKIDCVILNYNDAVTTKKLVVQIAGYACLNQIIIVDNASTDDSFVQLQKLEGEKVAVLQAKHNGGYGAGNNIGIAYSIKNNNSSHIIIANPDVVFTEDCVNEMAGVFASGSMIGIVSASMEDATFGKQRNGWRLHGFMGELLSMGPISRRVFRRWLEYPDKYFQDKYKVYVDRVHGSMLMVEKTAFMVSGGYDEAIFLYQEEMVLAQRMKKAGYHTVLLLNQSYKHEHSVSIKKTFKSQIGRQKLRHQSVMYYLKKYLHINKMQVLFARLWFGIILLEIVCGNALGYKKRYP